MYDIKFGMLQVRENEIPLRKSSDGTAQLRYLEGNTGGGGCESTVSKACAETLLQKLSNVHWRSIPHSTPRVVKSLYN